MGCLQQYFTLPIVSTVIMATVNFFITVPCCATINTAHVTNSEVRSTIEAWIGETDNLLKIVKTRKLWAKLMSTDKQWPIYLRGRGVKEEREVSGKLA